MVDPAVLVEKIADRSLGAVERATAERELCEHLAPRIRLYGVRHLRDDAAAADLVQEALMVLLERARKGRIDSPEHVARFVLGTCRNLVSRIRRNERRTKSFESSVLPLVEQALPPAFSRLDAAKLALCLARVDRRAQRVVLLTFQEDRTADEIATEIGTSPGNVRIIRHRALAALALCVEAGTA